MSNSRSKNHVVAFICTSLDQVAGGLERQLIRVAEQLSQYKFKVIIISYDNTNANSFYRIPKNIEWIKCGNGLIPHRKANLFKRIKQIYKLRKLLQNYDVTELITFHHGLYPRSFLATIFLNIKNIVSERNSLSNYKYIKLNKFNIGFLSLFLADIITVQLETYINDYPKLLRKRIKVVPNLLFTTSTYKEPPIDKKIVTMMGRLCPQKNFSPLLDQYLARPDIYGKLKIRIAGEGHLRKLFERKYKDLIDNNSLEILGNINNTQQFLRDSSIFCFPSLWEGYPNSLVEALSNGLPVVLSSRLKNLVDFVEDDLNGKIVEDSNYLDTILEMFENIEGLKLMSKKSFDKFTRLSSLSSINKWIDIIC